jgi:hypothetical protein
MLRHRPPARQRRCALTGFSLWRSLIALIRFGECLGTFGGMHPISYAGVFAVLAVGLAGCAAPVVAGLTVGEISTIAGLASTATTGKGLTDHALSYATGKDCNLVESVLRKDRKLCETPDSPEAQKDFKGLFKDNKAEDAAAPVKIAEVQVSTLPPVSAEQPHRKPLGRQYAMITGPADASGVPTARIIVFPDPRPDVPPQSQATLVASAASPPIPKPRAP